MMKNIHLVLEYISLIIGMSIQKFVNIFVLFIQKIKKDYIEYLEKY